MKKIVKSMYKYENFYQHEYKYVAGVDEVGRGCWAGPVVAACVIFPIGYKNNKIKDSKVLSKSKRLILDQIIKKNAIAYSISYVDAFRIDKINIKNASQEAMINAINKMKIKPNCVLVDAEEIKIPKIKIIPIIKGDSKSISIAAASIIAKVYRDNLCDKLDKIYPQYYFSKNKGYGTQVHINSLKKYGPIKGVHRFSYQPIKNFIK